MGRSTGSALLSASVTNAAACSPGRPERQPAARILLARGAAPDRRALLECRRGLARGGPAQFAVGGVVPGWTYTDEKGQTRGRCFEIGEDPAAAPRSLRWHLLPNLLPLGRMPAMPDPLAAVPLTVLELVTNG